MEGYSVELGFSPKAEAKLRKIGVAITERGLHSEFVSSENKPHITLSAFDKKVDVEQLRSITAGFATCLSPFDVTFHSVAQFITSQNVIYLAPLMTADLFNLYRQFYDRLTEAGLEPGFYYRPAAWTPHTTVTMKGPTGEIAETMAIVRKAPVFNIPMRISSINISRYSPFNLIDHFPLSTVQEK